MVDIVNFLLLVIALVLLSRLAVWVFKRCTLIAKLYELKKECKAKITLLRFPFLPNFLSSEKPDISVEILDTVYLIRLYSGGIGRIVHFATPEYSVRFSRMRAGRYVTSGRWRAKIADSSSGTFNVGMKVFVMPEMKTPDTVGWNKQVIRILLFNPAPMEVSYVTEEKTTIKLAFTGDEMYGMKIFTASSFVAYADRQTRKNDEFRYFT